MNNEQTKLELTAVKSELTVVKGKLSAMTDRKHALALEVGRLTSSTGERLRVKLEKRFIELYGEQTLSDMRRGTKAPESWPVESDKVMATEGEHRVEVKDCMDCPLLSYDTHDAYNWCAHPDKDCPDAEDSELADKGLPKKCPLRKMMLVIVGQP